MLFTKMNGLGNDYIFIFSNEIGALNPNELSRKLSDRHFGIGGDGLVLIGNSDKADFSMRIFNADGSEGEMCGNALRCVGKLVFEKKLTDKRTIIIETLAGVKEVFLDVENGVVKNVGANIGKGKFIGSEEGDEIEISGKKVKGYHVSMGNPHFVVLTDDFTDINNRGSEICENKRYFPGGVNVEFVDIKGCPKYVDVVVYERGSGLTFACGTGAGAVFFVLNRKKFVDKRAAIRLPGGEIDCRITSNNDIIICGPTKINFEGQIKEF